MATTDLKEKWGRRIAEAYSEMVDKLCEESGDLTDAEKGAFQESFREVLKYALLEFDSTVSSANDKSDQLLQLLEEAEEATFSIKTSKLPDDETMISCQIIPDDPGGTSLISILKGLIMALDLVMKHDFSGTITPEVLGKVIVSALQMFQDPFPPGSDGITRNTLH